MTKSEKLRAISAFIDANPRMIYWLALKISRKLRRPETYDGSELHEIANDLVLHCLEKADNYKPERSKIPTWLWWQHKAVLSKKGYHAKSPTRQFERTLATSFQVWDRRQGQREAVDRFHAEVDARTPQVEINSREDLNARMREAFSEAIPQLPELQARTVEAIALKGFSARRWAVMRRVHKNSVDQSLSNAFRRLRQNPKICALAREI